MNDKIKEILYNIKDKNEYYVQDIVSGDDLKQLLDYITNLQQENERLKDNLETMTFTAKVKQEAVDSLISRIDKVVEYIKECMETTYKINDYWTNELVNGKKF